MFRDIRQVLVLMVCLPIALVIGYILTTPTELDSIVLFGILLSTLALPLVMQWHHTLLIIVWNAWLVVFFVPGQPMLVFLVAGISLGLAVFTAAMRKQKRSLKASSVGWSLIFIALVVLVTAKLSGGIGSRALGGGEIWGAKRYLGVFGAVIGYFALISQQIPKHRVALYASLFFLSGVTAAFSDIAYATDASFLFNFFPSELASLQATSNELGRLNGVAIAALSICNFILLKYGIVDCFNWRKPWRSLLFLLVLAISLLGGFRSALLTIALICLVQSKLEKAMGRFLFGLVVGGFLIAIPVVMTIDKMPLSIQRSLSFLPIKNIDPAAKSDAASTVDWRLHVWKILLPEVRSYLLLGKGYSFSGTDLYLTQWIQQGGKYEVFESVLVSGNYHNGVLTLIIPFGIWGIIGFIWFCVASIRVLYANYKFGDPDLKKLNTFLLSFFIAHLFYYVVVYGQFDIDLMLFSGIVGLSISANGGYSKSRQQELHGASESKTLAVSSTAAAAM